MVPEVERLLIVTLDQQVSPETSAPVRLPFQEADHPDPEPAASQDTMPLGKLQLEHPAYTPAYTPVVLTVYYTG